MIPEAIVRSAEQEGQPRKSAMEIHPRLLAKARQKHERLQQILLSERDTAVTNIENAMAGLEKLGRNLNLPCLAKLTKNLGNLRKDLTNIEPTSPPSSEEVDLILARMRLLQIAANMAVDLLRIAPRRTPQQVCLFGFPAGGALIRNQSPDSGG